MEKFNFETPLILTFFVLASILLVKASISIEPPPHGTHVKCTKGSIPPNKFAYTFKKMPTIIEKSGVRKYPFQLDRMQKNAIPDPNMQFNVAISSKGNLDFWNQPWTLEAIKRRYVFTVYIPKTKRTYSYLLSNYDSCDVDIPGLSFSQDPDALVLLYKLSD